MAYVTPTGRTTGDLITAAIWNQDVVDNPTALYSRDAMLLLKADSGTTTAAGAENVSTLAMASALTVKDHLLVFVHLKSATQQTASAVLYNNTDAYNVADLNNAAAITADAFIYGRVLIGPDKSDSKRLMGEVSITTPVSSDTDGAASPSAITVRTLLRSFTTDWTGAWTLALRHGGVTGGGTLHWKWVVYRLLGQ